MAGLAGRPPVTNPANEAIKKILGGGGGGGAVPVRGPFPGGGGSASPTSMFPTQVPGAGTTGLPTQSTSPNVPGAVSGVPAVPTLENTTTPDPKLQDVWKDYQAAQTTTPKVDELWDLYKGQLDSSNLDRLQDVTGSKIRDRYEGASSALDADLARRGILGSGVEGELRSEMAMSEAGDLAQSDASLALADQARRDNLILSGQPLATYDRNRLDALLAQGMSIAQAQHILSNQDKALGLEQWQTMLGAQLAREQFGLQRDIAAQSVQAQQQAQMISLLSAMAPLFGFIVCVLPSLFG